MFKKGELVQLLDKRKREYTAVKKSSTHKWFHHCDDIAIVCKDTGTGLPIGIRMKVKENITCCFTNGETLYVLTKYVKRL